ncbi:hypothetical protein [Nostoc sp. NMS9]|uniref:hypothetical protein n=1 Tax=Nostoc sp. NMS9 TaxID=2815393 RepID=UPI0025E21654|nr:hypothetical protein [Nostoc sp. NMS9]MBN3944481.1 hypothetical protein [Nostoc sp. NMS9]
MEFLAESAFESLQLIKFDKKAIAHRDFVLIYIIVTGAIALISKQILLNTNCE